jgi:arylsulfatase A-like enzyme
VNAQAKRPNILVIFGDDIGQTNISAYGLGVVGYKTPNIDRIAREGMMFTDYYAKTVHGGSVILHQALATLGIANDTIVIYSTDNGPNQFSWPDAATTPFRSEKDTNWEGAFRVPAMVRWPGHIQAGSVSTDIFSGLDWFPTLLAAARDATIKDRLLKGTNVGGTTFQKCISMATINCLT